MKRVLILQYYKSIVDGVMTSMIDTYFNVGEHGGCDIKIICPELYLLDRDDFYDKPLDETAQHLYVDKVGIETKDMGKFFGWRTAQSLSKSNMLTTSIPFLRFNRNFGDHNLFNAITQTQKQFEADNIICSGRLIYEILNGVDMELRCNKLVVLDSLDTYRSKVGLFPDFDDFFDTLPNTEIVQLSNPATMRDSKYRQIEYYHKFSEKRLSALKQSGLIKEEVIFSRTRTDKGHIQGKGYFENIGKKIFEHLYFNKPVYYKSEGMFTKDGLWYYLDQFGVDGTKDQTLDLSRSEIVYHLGMSETDPLLREIK